MESMGVASGCGCKEVYRFLIYPYSSCICSFLQQHPYFLFFVCSGTFLYGPVASSNEDHNIPTSANEAYHPITSSNEDYNVSTSVNDTYEAVTEQHNLLQ